MLSVKSLNIYHKSVNSSTKILSDVGFDILPGGIYSIVGRNGAGKSTLIKSLTRLLPEEYEVGGSILWKNSDLNKLRESDLLTVRRSGISYVFQETNDSFDNLKRLKYYFGLVNAPEAEINELLEYFLLPEFATLRNKYPFELSGGMAQRVNIVLSILRNPELLIMDEPTSSVDLPLVNLIIFKLREFVGSGEKSVLLITHDLLLALRISDRIAFLSGGRLNRFVEPDVFLKGGRDVTEDEFLSASRRLGEI